MARIRTVKPELFKHEELFELELDSGLPVRLSFIGLFTCCDREGRFKWRPRTLKTDIFPYDNVDFSRVLDALATRGFVVKYQVNDEDFGFIPTFRKHQVINNRESASRIPEPDETSIESITSTRDARVDDAPSTRLKNAQVEGKGKGREEEKEGNGKKGSANASFSVLNLTSDGLSEELAYDFMIHRKQLKAPLTQRAWDGIKREASIANWTLDAVVAKCLEKGWRSFEAEWVMRNSNRATGKQAEWDATTDAFLGTKRGNPDDPFTIDMEV